MSPEQAGKFVRAAVRVSREDIARAKNWLVQNCKGPRTTELADNWLHVQNLVVPRKIDTDAPDCEDILAVAAKAFSVRLAFLQAINEMVAAGELIPSAPPSQWKAHLDYQTSHYGGCIPVDIACSYPERVESPPFASSEPVDTDIFLSGVDCKSLHPGILKAIEQSLACFRRGLYLPATAMLAAAVEGAWAECGSAVAKKLPDTKLEGVVGNDYASIAKKVAETHKTLEKPTAKNLLKNAGKSIADIRNAEIWTTALRERRNALHWGKNQSFVADHSETGTLLMGAPQHLGTLEAIRAVC